MILIKKQTKYYKKTLGNDIKLIIRKKVLTIIYFKKGFIKIHKHNDTIDNKENFFKNNRNDSTNKITKINIAVTKTNKWY